MENCETKPDSEAKPESKTKPVKIVIISSKNGKFEHSTLTGQLPIRKEPVQSQQVQHDEATAETTAAPTTASKRKQTFSALNDRNSETDERPTNECRIGKIWSDISNDLAKQDEADENNNVADGKEIGEKTSEKTGEKTGEKAEEETSSAPESDEDESDSANEVELIGSILMCRECDTRIDLSDQNWAAEVKSCCLMQIYESDDVQGCSEAV